jgi:predicted ATPase
MSSTGHLQRMTASDFPVTFAVQGLFDRFDHEITLPRQDDPIRFVTAPNGYGKSTLLRLLADLTAENHVGVASAYWRKLKIGYESGAVLHAERETRDSHFQELNYRLELPGRDDALADRVLSNELQRYVWESSRWRNAQMRRANPTDDRGSEGHSARDSFDSYGPPPRPIRLRRELRRALRIVNATYLDVHRLGPRGRAMPVFGRGMGPSRRGPAAGAIVEVAKSATAVLRNAKLKYLADSRGDEQTFANRAVDALNNRLTEDSQSLESVAQHVRQLERLYERLGELGVIAPLTSQAVDVMSRLKGANDAAVPVILLYWGDVVRRLRRLKNRVRSLELYRDVVNSLLEGKEIRFRGDCDEGENEGQGLEVHVGDHAIPLDRLSDGEQHLLVIFGELLFGRLAQPRGLLLLDEPENSLHPEWQAALGTTLGRLAANSRRRVLVATHSPIIIGDSWEREISLDRRESK